MQKAVKHFISTALKLKKPWVQAPPMAFCAQYVITSTHHRQTGAKVIITKTRKAACEFIHRFVFSPSKSISFLNCLYRQLLHVKHFFNFLPISFLRPGKSHADQLVS